MRRILFLRSNPIDPDPRVEKEASTLAKAGYQVRVVGWDLTGRYPRHVVTDFGVLERLHVHAHLKGGRANRSGLANLPHYLRFQLGLVLYLLRMRKAYDVVHACDFDTLMPALFAKVALGKKVIYDIFDFYADMMLRAPKWLKALVRWLEVRLMGYADAVILADESRVQQIEGARPRKLTVIYNSPHLDIPAASIPPYPPFRVGYVGVLSRTRGIMEMIEAVSRSPLWELELAGFGDDEEEIIAHARAVERVRFWGRVSYERALGIYASSHLLFATYDPAVPNHRFSSANKLFEAMAIGRPIIVARGTGMDRIVERHGLGFVVEYGRVDHLEEVLKTVESWDRDRWDAFAQHSRAVYKANFAWEKQAERLLSLYQDTASARLGPREVRNG